MIIYTMYNHCVLTLRLEIELGAGHSPGPKLDNQPNFNFHFTIIPISPVLPTLMRLLVTTLMWPVTMVRSSMVTDCTGATGLAGYTALPIQLSVDYKPEVVQVEDALCYIEISFFSSTLWRFTGWWYWTQWNYSGLLYFLNVFIAHLHLVHSPEVALGPKIFFDFFASKW